MEANDPFNRFKYIGYCRVDYPTETRTIADLVKIAKFYLCKKTKTLWKDPIWDSYIDEEILVEYFSWIFSESKEYKEDYEAEIEKVDVEKESIFNWLEEKVTESQLELKEAEKFEDSITFDPNDLKGT